MLYDALEIFVSRLLITETGENNRRSCLRLHIEIASILDDISHHKIYIRLYGSTHLAIIDSAAIEIIEVERREPRLIFLPFSLLHIFHVLSYFLVEIAESIGDNAVISIAFAHHSLETEQRLRHGNGHIAA